MFEGYCYDASMLWLKKKIKKMGLSRRGSGVVYTSLSLVKNAIRVILYSSTHQLCFVIQSEIQGPNCNVGYRQIWEIMKTKPSMDTQ